MTKQFHKSEEHDMDYMNTSHGKLELDHTDRFSVKLTEDTGDQNWNKELLENRFVAYGQSNEYLSYKSLRYQKPLFVYVVDKLGDTVGQIGLVVRKLGYDKRLFWYQGPAIKERCAQYKSEIFLLMMRTIEKLASHNGVTIIDGYTALGDTLIDDEFLNMFKQEGFNVTIHFSYAIDLSMDLDALWKDVSKRTRQYIKEALREGIEVKMLENYDQMIEYHQLGKKWLKHKGFKIRDDGDMVKMSWENHKLGIDRIFLAYQHDVLVSALKISVFNGISCASEVINSYNESKISGKVLTWSAIKWSKENGCRIYDITGGVKGINEVKTPKVQKGFVYYKQRWGGQELLYYQLTKIVDKRKYKIFRIITKMNRIKKSIKNKLIK